MRIHLIHRVTVMILTFLILLCIEVFGYQVRSFSQDIDYKSSLRHRHGNSGPIWNSAEEEIPSKPHLGYADSRQLQSTSRNNFVFNTKAVEHYAYMKGLELRPKVQGIFVTLEAHPVGKEAKIGYLSAFLRPIPSDTLHLDTIRVQNRRQKTGLRKVRWSPESGLISFIMGSWALCWARERGCKRAELMAIKDSEEMNKILVRLYSSFGFQVMREIGDSLSTVPDQIVWGGVGTLMSLDIESFFVEWTPKFELMMEKEELRVQARMDTANDPSTPTNT